MPIRFPLRFVTALALVLLIACQTTSGAKQPPDDEAKMAGLTVRNFRYPISEATNFLKGMDGIAVPKGSTPENPLTLPVDQLLDKAPAAVATELADPVATQNEILGRN